MTETLNTFRAGPDGHGHFGIFGGRYVAETLVLLLDVEKAYERQRLILLSKGVCNLLEHYVETAQPLYFALAHYREMWGRWGLFKRDELNHTGAHKINNTLGQVLLARRMGKTRDS